MAIIHLLPQCYIELGLICFCGSIKHFKAWPNDKVCYFSCQLERAEVVSKYCPVCQSGRAGYIAEPVGRFPQLGSPRGPWPLSEHKALCSAL